MFDDRWYTSSGPLYLDQKDSIGSLKDMTVTEEISYIVKFGNMCRSMIILYPHYNP